MKNLLKKICKKIVPIAFALTIPIYTYSQEDSKKLSIQLMTLEDQISSMEMDSMKMSIYDRNNDGEKDSIYIKKFKKSYDVISTVEYKFIHKEDSFEIKGPKVIINGIQNKPYPYDRNILRNAPREITYKTKSWKDGTYVFNSKGQLIR